MSTTRWQCPTTVRKVVLIEPKSPGVHIFTRFGLPRLGVVLLGTILAQRGYGVEVQIEDIQPLDWSGLLDADLVGISTITPTAPQSYMLADALRAVGIPVVLGGVHVTFLPDEGLEHADFVVRGEGEDTIVVGGGIASQVSQPFQNEGKRSKI